MLDQSREIAERFEMLHEMTKAAVGGDIRAMIVSGPPGVGKSYGVEQEIEKQHCLTLLQARSFVQKLSKVPLLLLACIKPCTSTQTRIAWLCLTTATASCLTT